MGYGQTRSDWEAREMLAAMSGLTVNDTTNKHTIRFIIGKDKNAKEQFEFERKQREKDLQNLLEKNMHTFFGVTFLKSEYKITSVRYQYFAEGARYPIIITVEQEITPIGEACKCSNSKYTAMFMEQPAVYKNDAISIKESKKSNSTEISSFNYLATPNPFTESIQVAFNLDKDAKVVIEILDLTGNSLLKLFNDKIEAGQYSYDFQTSGLFPGTYVLSLNVNGKVYTNKMLKAGK